MAVSEKKLSALLSLVAIALFVAINFHDLWTGSLRIRDEYATLDRSNSFYMRGDYSVVFSENQPNFRKPPLQYWMSAGLLNAGAPPLFAVRFPSFLFAIGLMICAGLLAYVLFPQQPFAAAAAAALMACNARLLGSSKVAMLDTGMAFFSTVAMIGLVLAVRNSRWWYLVAAACALGALQKAPVALGMIAIAILALLAAKRFRLAELRGLVFGRHFWVAALITALTILAWPLMQWASYGFDALREAYYVQMMQRFAPMAEIDRSTRTIWYQYILDSDRIFRIPAIIAMFSVPFLLKRRELLIFPLFVVLYAVAVLFAKGQLFSRYSIVFLPFMAASLAICIFYLVRQRMLAGVVVLLFCGQNIFVPTQRQNQSDEPTIALLQKFSGSLHDSGSFILCDWTAGNRARIPPGMFSYYASGGRPFFAVESPEAFVKLQSSGAIGPHLFGFCTREQLAAIERYLPNLVVLEDYTPYVNWRSG